ncbi:MAG TPA: TerB family tellurite resistance protein, partial [Polyangiaceae bacterium]|nr:TerB family tellurite resistance protein [Polyangiaceae bacterium]
MKVRDRIGPIADLFLGAMYADERFDAEEKEAVRRLLCDLIVRPELPPELEQRIAEFDPASFDLAATARDFARDPPMNRRRLLELVAQLCVADGELDLDEDDYLHRLARELGMEPSEYEDIVLDYESHELRKSFELLRTSSLDLPPAS